MTQFLGRSGRPSDRAEVSFRPGAQIGNFGVVSRALRPRRGYRAVQILRDPAAHRNLSAHGYHVTAPLVNESVIAALTDSIGQWLEASPPDSEGRFHSSFEHEPTDAGIFARQQVIRLLLPALRPQVSESALLRPSVFQCKPPGPASGLRSHQDAFLVDERNSYGLHAWVALTHITLNDGPLFMLPGSHRYGTWTRVSTPEDDLDGLHEAIGRGARALELVPGQVVWFDHATIHGSLINRGTSMRLAVSAVAVPSAPVITVPVRSDNNLPGQVDLRRIDPDTALGDLPPSLDDAELVGIVELDQLRFSPWAVRWASRLHSVAHRGAQGTAIPARSAFHA